jgi:hypothetical protein
MFGGTVKSPRTKIAGACAFVFFISVCLIVVSIMSPSDTMKIGFGIAGGFGVILSVAGCTYGCTTNRYDIDDLPPRIREDMGFV